MRVSLSGTTLRFDSGETFSGETDANGQFSIFWLTLSSGSYVAEVGYLDLDGYTWDKTRGVLDGDEPEDDFPDLRLQI